MEQSAGYKLFKVIGVYWILGEQTTDIIFEKVILKERKEGKKLACNGLKQRDSRLWEGVQAVKDGGDGVRKELYQKTSPQALPH